MPAAIHYIGLLKSPVSWAKVGRELIAALARQGAHVSAVSLRGYLYDEKYPYMDDTVKEAAGRERREGWDVALDYPPNFARLDGRRKAGILIYEADRFPSHWVEAANRHLDLAIVPSRFCLEAAAASGIARERLRVVPFGVDTATYAPGNSPGGMSTGRSFNFLTVGAPHVRKGLREVMEAFCTAFSIEDDVGLVLKSHPVGQLGKRPWEYKAISDFMSPGRRGQVMLLADTAAEPWMAGLYRAHDVYVQASYGEAFGLAAVEAAACGKAVITTDWGAAGEMFGEKNAYPVEYDLVDASSFAYDWRASEEGVAPRMARPRVESLASAMRRAYEDSGQRASKGAAALETARTLTWDEAAKELIKSLSE